MIDDAAREKFSRLMNQRAQFDALMPGFSPVFEITIREIEKAVDEFKDAQRRFVASIAGDPVARLEHALRLVDLPDELVAIMIDDNGDQYVREILQSIASRVEALSAKVEHIPAKGEE